MIFRLGARAQDSGLRWKIMFLPSQSQTQSPTPTPKTLPKLYMAGASEACSEDADASSITKTEIG